MKQKDIDLQTIMTVASVLGAVGNQIDYNKLFDDIDKIADKVEKVHGNNLPYYLKTLRSISDQGRKVAQSLGE